MKAGGQVIITQPMVIPPPILFPGMAYAPMGLGVLPLQSGAVSIYAQAQPSFGAVPFQVPAVLRYEQQQRRFDMSNERQRYMAAGSDQTAPPPTGGTGGTPPPSSPPGSGSDENGDGNGNGKKPPRNFYDNGTFYSSYVGMRQGTHSANDYIEKPYLRKIMPDVSGMTVLDLGCGMGNNILNFMTNAASVDAVDISENMLAHLKNAVDERGLKNVNIIRSSIEEFGFKTDRYDLIVSTLAFHYIEDLNPVFEAIFRSLKKGGAFIFNVEHPVYTATKNQGWETKENGEHSHWRLDDYFEPGARRVMWHGIEVERYHRTVEDYFKLLVDNGFQVEMILEPQPDDEARRLDPELNRHHRRPPFLMFLARKR